MRFKYAYLSLFFFLFLSITSNNALAFEQFNSNPDFSSTYNGFGYTNLCYPSDENNACDGLPFLEYLYCIATGGVNNQYAFSISQNSTGYNDATGILLLEPTENCSWSTNNRDVQMMISLRSDNTYYNYNNASNLIYLYSALTNYSDSGSYFNLDKNKEGIIYLRWRTNSTSDFVYGETYLIWYDNFGNSNYTYFGGTWTDWVNTSLYIPANIYEDRKINVILQYKIASASAPIQIQIDRFSFYTFDIIEPRISYFTDFSTEALEYCGVTGANNCSTSQTGCFNKLDSTLKIAYLLTNTTDGLRCCVFQNGNFTIARRCTPSGSDGCAGDTSYDNQWLHWTMRDLAFLKHLYGTSYPSGIGVLDATLLIQQLSTISIKYTKWNTSTYSGGASSHLIFNGVGEITWTSNTGAYVKALSNTTVLNDVKLLTSFNISGTKFYDKFNYSGGVAKTSINQTFPNFQYITSTSCTCTDNIETCTDETGTIATTNCGCYGCDSDSQYCSSPTIINTYGFGTFCYKTINSNSTNLRGYVTYFDYSSENCTSGGLYDACGSDEYCYQSELNSISCLKIVDNTTSYTVDSLGIEHGPTTPAEDLASGKLDISGLACTFGTGSGFGCEGGKFFIGMIIFLSILGALNGIDMLYSKNHKFLPKEINVIIMVMLLVGLTIFIPLFNPLMLIIVVIFGIVLLASKIIPTVTPHQHEGG